MNNENINANRKKVLKAVRYILSSTASPFGISSPRFDKAAIFAAPILLATFMATQLWIVIIVAAVVFAVVWVRTPSETWNERFCKLLKDYPPLDDVAFQLLLHKIKDGTAERKDILEWLRTESAHVERPNEVAAEQDLLNSRLH